jgi:lipoprotein signal peptidase
MSTNSKRSYRWLLWTLALVGCAVDQAGKYGVFALLQDEAMANSHGPKAERTVIPGALKFHVEFTGEEWPTDTPALQNWSGPHQPHVNRGAFLGFGSGNGEGPNGNLIFAIVSIVAAGAIIWWSTRRSIAQDALLCTALGLILAGTLGNLYDRIIFDGVRDYLYWFFVFHTAVFNIADFLLICGAGLLLIQAFWGGKHTAQEPSRREVVTSREVAAAAEMK